MDTVLENILTRTSVRSYTEKKIDSQTLELLLKAGMAAPSAMNRQPWRFILITERAVLDSLATRLPYAKMAAEAQAGIVVCGDMDATGEGEKDLMWVSDCSAATENILLAAHALGLGAVWTAVYPVRDRMETVVDVLHLPSKIVPLCFVPVGYPVGTERVKEKFKKDNIHLNRW
ncbi:MAG: nitroreductase family protein [Spirochaetia bacterium]|jgi:nitroreductase|nr:nitroreductase family protein [Spirochaetia bacterium]MCH3917784.1 nitroreductase family protein [Spirochaetia bacterium]